MEKGNDVRLNKIPLKLFIDALIDIYTAGAEYIDLVGKTDVEQDSIGIVVKVEYMNKEDREEEDNNDNNKSTEYFDNLSNEILKKIKDTKLSDEDLNGLL